MPHEITVNSYGPSDRSGAYEPDTYRVQSRAERDETIQQLPKWFVNWLFESKDVAQIALDLFLAMSATREVDDREMRTVLSATLRIARIESPWN